MFNPSRDRARRFFIDKLGKIRRGDALTPLEEKDRRHHYVAPEYHHACRTRSRSSRPTGSQAGDINPSCISAFIWRFRRQLDIDQPPGIRAIHAQLAAKAMMSMPQSTKSSNVSAKRWQSQRTGQALDGALYLSLLLRQRFQQQ